MESKNAPKAVTFAFSLATYPSNASNSTPIQLSAARGKLCQLKLITNNPANNTLSKVSILGFQERKG